MRIININLEDEYPENYDNLDETKKREIEKYMNDEQETANRHYEKHITTDSERENLILTYIVMCRMFLSAQRTLSRLCKLKLNIIGRMMASGI